ncbi:DUF808 domain-containing protein [Demequina sp. TTPB684]|uniref:DUF808 domain-containing protein n=1 Tax=unclassified Demequina TaxID=2620311 RepID=UPI001CF5637B|nr:MULTISPECIES: DUF808 domain-containing protein [unclassified Demequina]MCB2411547.1 DUF808 domain-containing protein [Demequina sp. TTPB684]UPU87824.1 DUF808 domain-containing protein [Demequina sp. TMPB413]
MAGGLVALLDDIAALAKLAAASVDDIGVAASRAGVKAAGVVIDDTAVTPRYLHGFTSARELPIVRRIAIGSLRNKLVFILPAALLLSQLLPWLLTPILMVGGTYLAFEGAEKLYELVTGHAKDKREVPAAVQGVDVEKTMVASAIRTDFILSTEIMVIALNEVADEPLVSRAIILAVVAVVITAIVYGVVALIVKMDDVGLYLAEKRTGASAAFGRALVLAMPKFLAVLSTVGIIAMLWVGGHILLVGLDELGWVAPYELVHSAEEAVHDIAGIGGFLGWLANTLASAMVGALVGSVVVTVFHGVQRLRGNPADAVDAH